MFQFFQTLLGYFFQIGKEYNKNMNWDKVKLLLTKNEKKISLNFIFVFQPPCFRYTCRSFLLSKYASQINLIQSIVRISCASQGPRVPFPWSRVLGSYVPSPGPQVASPSVPSAKFQAPCSRIPCLRASSPKVPSPRVPGPWSYVLILDYAL